MCSCHQHNANVSTHGCFCCSCSDVTIYAIVIINIYPSPRHPFLAGMDFEIWPVKRLQSFNMTSVLDKIRKTHKRLQLPTESTWAYRTGKRQTVAHAALGKHTRVCPSQCIILFIQWKNWPCKCGADWVETQQHQHKHSLCKCVWVDRMTYTTVGLFTPAGLAV